jgi:hypothetical protein
MISLDKITTSSLGCSQNNPCFHFLGTDFNGHQGICCRIGNKGPYTHPIPRCGFHCFCYKGFIKIMNSPGMQALVAWRTETRFPRPSGGVTLSSAPSVASLTKASPSLSRTMDTSSAGISKPASKPSSTVASTFFLPEDS